MHTWVPERIRVSCRLWEQFSKALIHFRNLQCFLKKLGTEGRGAGLTTEGSKPHIFWCVNRREEDSVSIAHHPKHRHSLPTLSKMKGLIVQWELNGQTFRIIWRHLWFTQSAMKPPVGALFSIILSCAVNTCNYFLWWTDYFIHLTFWLTAMPPLRQCI